MLQEPSCDNVATSQISGDVTQPKSDLHTTFIGCVPIAILRCIDVVIRSVMFIIFMINIFISVCVRVYVYHIFLKK